MSPAARFAKGSVIFVCCCCCSGCDGGDRPVYSLGWAAFGGVSTLVAYPYPLPAATRICNSKYTKMKRAFTGGSVEIDLTSFQALFKVCGLGVFKSSAHARGQVSSR